MLSTLEVLLFFHGLSLVKFPVRQKSVRVLRNAAVQTGTTIEIVNQINVKVFRSLCCGALLLPLSEVTEPYIMFFQQPVRFTLLSLHVNVFALIAQSKSLDDVTGPLTGPYGVNVEVNGRKVNKTVHFDS